ncbi:MAG: ribonuclease R [Clostridia bacterium]|nr:ribonuclease R [Clostridia bacterium]
MDRKQLLDDFIHDKEYVPMKYKDIAAILGVPGDEMIIFGELLDELVYDGRIIKERDGKYVPVETEAFVAGKFMKNRKGFGFVRSDENCSDDIFISAENSAYAMNNDRVLVKILKPAGTSLAEGKIVKITSRKNTHIVGTIYVNRNVVFLIPDDENLGSDIFISNSKSKKYKSGMKAVAQIVRWPQPNKCAAGIITEILGFSGDKGVDVMSVIRNYGIRDTFSDSVTAQAKSKAASPVSLKKRKDLRNLLTITIDGADAKDLDDAVSLEKLKDMWRLGVHIADVSEYVTEGSILDKEAYKRGTSVYFADRVVPMLPEALSNGACSLNPDEEKLALSVFMEIDKNGNVNSYDICESVIKSDYRMTYNDVTAILEGDNTLCKQSSKIVSMLTDMKELALILNKKRLKRGSIEFDFPEAKAILDENGKAIDIVLREMSISNSIIEEFMLVCNETVAEHGFWGELPFMYRVHETPDENKINNLRKMLGLLGYSIKNAKEIHSSQFNSIIEQSKGKAEEKVLSTLMLRSLMKARYSPECLGHWGLGAKYYCHFTSPIRRYPDLVVHRILKLQLHGKLNEKELYRLSEFVESASIQSSECEIIAQDAERDIMDIKKAEYACEHIGEENEGVISSVTSYGMFVEYPNTVEGLVRYADIEYDYFEFDSDTLSAIGNRTGTVFRVGDKVKTVITGAYPECGKIDMMIVD